MRCEWPDAEVWMRSFIGLAKMWCSTPGPGNPSQLIPVREKNYKNRKSTPPLSLFKVFSNFLMYAACYSEAQTFRQCEDFGVHLSAELFVVQQVFVIV